MSKQANLAFVISFLLLLSVIILNRYTFHEMKKYTERVNHTHEVITVLESISNHFKSAQIYSPSLDSFNIAYYRLYRTEAESLSNELQTLRGLVHDNPGQAARADSLSVQILSEMGLLMQKNIAEIIQSGEGHRLNQYLKIHESINEGIRQEKELLAERERRLNQSTSQNTLLSTIFAILGVTILLYTFYSLFVLSRKRNWLEGFLESIMNNSRYGIVHYKAVRENGKIIDFRLEFVNSSVDALLGVKGQDLLGKKLSQFSSFIREENLFERYVSVVETGKPEEFEFLYKRNGIERWMLVSLVKLTDGLTASFHDITQLKHYEEELKQNIQNLQRSNTELEQYAYVASHDLQEPLRKIRSFGSYLRDTQASKLDEKGRQQLDKILSSAERMSILIKDILSFSAINKEGTLQSTNLNEVVRSVMQDLDLLIQQKEARIEIEPLPVIEAVPLQMQQLFYNLVNNSLKFTHKDRQPLIRISCRKLNEEEKPSGLLARVNYYEIILSDNGIGFNAEYEDQIFGLFKRLNDKQFYPGSGIGLALCKKVLENHQGDIVAKGKEGEGASFVIYLPEKQ